MLLMCKDKKVFNITQEKILNEGLLPGPLQFKPTKEVFVKWMDKRRRPGMTGNLFEKDKETLALSLSDCYWIWDEVANGNPPNFKDISPFHRPWDDYYFKDKGFRPDPNAYVRNSQLKSWLKPNLLKCSSKIDETWASCVARYLIGDYCCLETGESGVNTSGERYCVRENLASDSMFLEVLSDYIVTIRGNHFGSVYEALAALDNDIAKGVLLVDLVIGNGARRVENMSVYRNANTGQYKGIAPIYSFQGADKIDASYNGLADLPMEMLRNWRSYPAKDIRDFINDEDFPEIYRENLKALMSYLNLKY